MKRLLYIGMVAVMAASCVRSNDSTDPDSGAQTTPQTITIEASTSPLEPVSRVALEQDDNNITTTWGDESQTLGAWSSSSESFAKFSMVSGSMSSDKESASFTGDVDSEATAVRLVYPYTDSSITSSGVYTIDLSDQSIDISSGKGVGSMGSGVHMISDLVTISDSAAASMSHLGAALEVGLTFEGITSDKSYTITKLLVGGNNGVDLPLTAQVDLAQSIGSSKLITTASAGAMSISVSGSPTIGNYADNSTTYSVMFNTLPFELSSGDEIMLGVELTADDNSTTSAVYSITYGGSESLQITSGTYTSLNYACTVALEAGGSIYDWGIYTDPDAGSIDLIKPAAEMTLDTFLEFVLNEELLAVLPGSDIWTITGDATDEQLVFMNSCFDDAGAYLVQNNRKISITFSDLTTIPEAAFAQCEGIYSFSAPEALVVEPNAFVFSSISHFSLPKVTEVGELAFGYCTVTSISIPNLITTGREAFIGCGYLQNIDLPNLETLAYGVFEQCWYLTYINCPNVTTINNYAFNSCWSLKEISMPKLEGALSEYAFSGCYSLVSVDLPAITQIDEGTFEYCESLKEISLPLVESVGPDAFYRCCSLVSVDLPSVTAVDEDAFEYCTSLEEITLPTVENLNSYVFYGCTALKSGYFPQLTYLGKRVFDRCLELKTLHLATDSDVSLMEIDSNCFTCSYYEYNQEIDQEDEVTVDLAPNIDLTLGAANAELVSDKTLTVSDNSFTFNTIAILSE